MWDDSFRCFPSIRILIAIIVAYYNRRPSFPVRETPCDIKCKCFSTLWSYCLIYRQWGHRIFIFLLTSFGQHTIRTKIIPKVENAIVPVIGFWRSTVSHAINCLSGKRNSSPCRIILIYTIRIKVYSFYIVAFNILVLVVLCSCRNVITFPVCTEFTSVLTYKVAYRTTDWYIHRLVGSVCNFIREYGHRQSAGIGIARNKRVKTLYLDFYRQIAVR